MSGKIRCGLLLVLILVFVLNLPVYASGGDDIKGHWAEKQVENWSNKGLIKGYVDGTFRPDRNVTRAEFVALVNNAFGYTAKASHGFGDVKASDWFAEEMGKAKAVGYIAGYSDGTFKPNNSISRQEAAVIICNILKLDISKYQNVSAEMSDSAKIPNWSKDKVNAVVSLGYMSGYPDKTFRQDKPITRAEVVVTLDKVVGELYNSPGVFGPETGKQSIKGNATISRYGVTLRNTVIEGNLYLTEGIGTGAVTLDNVTVKGLTIVSGGGLDSIIVINSTLGTVVVDVPDGAKVRLVATGSTEISSVETRSKAKLEEGQLTGPGFKEVVIRVPAGADVELKGEFGKVQVQTPNAKVSLLEGRIDRLNVSDKGAGASVNIAAGTAVHLLILDAKTSVTGTGTIHKAEIIASGVVLDIKPLSLIVAPGITATVAGTTVTGNNNNGSTGGGGGTSPQKVAVPTANPGPGAVPLGTAITLATSTVDAIIYYTTDGSTPTTSSPQYNPENKPVIDTAKTIKAIAVKAGMTNSDMAIFIYTIANPVIPGPFVPGEGGNISAPSFANEPGRFGGLYIAKSHIEDYDNSWELVLLFRPYGDYPEGDLVLQYSADNGVTWAEVEDYDNWGNEFILAPEAAYQYRLATAGSNEYTSNVVEAALPNVNAYACFGYLDVNSTGITVEDLFINPPYVGSGLYADAWAYDSMYDEWTGPEGLTEYLSYQWYRVNPVTFEMSSVEGATDNLYIRTEDDLGYLILVQAFLEGDNTGVFAQSLYYPYWHWDPPFTIMPNKAYITNLTQNGFTLNLDKGVDGITPEDLRLYECSSWDDIPILAVTKGQNNAVYHITAQIPEESTFFYLENFSDVWWIVTEWEGWIQQGLEISKAQTIDISGYVNGGTVEGTGSEGFSLDTTPGAEKVNIALGTSPYANYTLIVTNSAQGTVQTFEIYTENYTWTVELYTTVLDLTNQIGTGSATQLQGVFGFTLNSGAKSVTIDEIWDVRDRNFYFDVSGGANDGKRYKVFYDGFWKTEVVAALITAIEIVGPDTIEIKRYEPSTAVIYTAVVKDQNGDTIADETVTWSIKVPQWGISVGANTGVVTLQNWIEETSFVLVATSATDNTVKVEKTLQLTKDARRENNIISTSVGVLSAGNIDAVPAGTKVSTLKAGLTVAEGATVEILTESGGDPVAEQETTDVTADMVIEVTAENGDKAEYTIIMATYSIDIVRNYLSGPQSVIGATLEMPYDPNPAILAPWYTWDHTVTGPIYVNRTGTGDITNLTVTSLDPEKFQVWLDHPWQYPGGWSDTLNSNRTSQFFYVYAIEGLSSGEHIGTIAITADNGVSASFSVRFRVGS